MIICFLPNRYTMHVFTWGLAYPFVLDRLSGVFCKKLKGYFPFLRRKRTHFTNSVSWKQLKQLLWNIDFTFVTIFSFFVIVPFVLLCQKLLIMFLVINWSNMFTRFSTWRVSQNTVWLRLGQHMSCRVFGLLF